MGNIKQELQKIKILNELYTKWKWRERHVSYGNQHPDKTFFVVRRASCKVGLFSHVMTNMGLVDYAVKQGYIPVVDMQSNANTYLEDDKIGKENAWEYYFKQPCGYSLTDIKEAKNVILSNGLITSQNSYPDFRITEEDELFQYWHNVFRQYFRPADEMAEEFERKRKELFGTSRILGILARGTDYVSMKPKGHPIQPTVEQIIEKATEIMKNYQCEKIYLATEDQEIYEKLMSAFDGRILAPETERFTTLGKQNINDMGSKERNNKVQKGREYLLSIMLLSGCNCLLAGNVGGTHGALLMNDEYEYKYIFELGYYR